MKKAEEILCRTVDVIFTVNIVLKKRLCGYATQVHLLKPALDDNFLKISESLCDTDKKDIEIGFVGSIDRRFDPEIVELIANKHPEWRILIIGPIMYNLNKLHKLRKIKNIEFIGLVKEKLANYYKRFKLGIIPYHVNEFTDVIVPLKIFEFFSFGTPVVSTPLKALRGLSKGQLLYLAEKEDFLETIEKIIHDGEQQILREKRIAFSSKNLWFKRIEYIQEVLSPLLQAQA
ncbi:MAG: glycosyltransferase [Candidatus Omnitrophota bacterium]